VRIIVIDSGVNIGHPHISGVSGGASVQADGSIRSGDFTDRLGHGTAVMAAIQHQAPGAECIALKLFHSVLRAHVDRLIGALEWAAAQRADLINLSLGTPNELHAARLASVVRKIAAAGPILVSACEAEGTQYYPGSLPGALGVCLDRMADRPTCRVEKRGGRVLIHASGHPRPIEGVPPHRNLSGVSFAVANATGILARALEDVRNVPGPPLIERLLLETHPALT
jgi:hypothetical protein